MSAKRKAIDSLETPSKRARKVLTLAKKIKVIDSVNTGKSHRAVAIDFNVGRTQINEIIHKRDSVKSRKNRGYQCSNEVFGSQTHVISRG